MVDGEKGLAPSSSPVSGSPEFCLTRAGMPFLPVFPWCLTPLPRLAIHSQYALPPLQRWSPCCHTCLAPPAPRARVHSAPLSAGLTAATCLAPPMPHPGSERELVGHSAQLLNPFSMIEHMPWPGGLPSPYFTRENTPVAFATLDIISL